MQELIAKKKGKWNQSNLFFELQNTKTLPFGNIQLGSNSIMAFSQDKSCSLELCEINEGEEFTNFKIKIGGPNRKIERQLMREALKVLKPKSTCEVNSSELDQVKQGIRKLFTSNVNLRSNKLEEKTDETGAWIFESPNFQVVVRERVPEVTEEEVENASN